MGANTAANAGGSRRTLKMPVTFPPFSEYGKDWMICVARTVFLFVLVEHDHMYTVVRNYQRRVIN
jgi:hypothetical protein